jgi:hypothetical protein
VGLNRGGELTGADLHAEKNTCVMRVVMRYKIEQSLVSLTFAVMIVVMRHKIEQSSVSNSLAIVSGIETETVVVN